MARLTIIIAIIVFADQITKKLVEAGMALHESIPLIPGLFNLTYIRNPGAAFGLFAEHANKGDGMSGVTLAFLVITVVSSAAIIYLYLTTHGTLARTALAMILGGAVGNGVDRVRYGEVTDFLDIYMGSYHWPAFNVADSAITIGVTLLAVYYLFIEPRQTAGVPVEPETSANPASATISDENHH